MGKIFVETIGKPDGRNWRIANASLMSFAQTIYGKCPNCFKATIIKADYKYFNSPENARVQCLNCTFYEDWNAEKIYGQAVGIAKKPCPNCGAKWLSAEVKINRAKPFKDHAEAVCSVCGKVSYLSLAWTQADDSAKPLDPFFRYDLWLQTECANNVLWVYNEKHLSYLREYIEADLRQDDGRKKWSMISRLPKWMTSAKNRKDVLNAVTKLEAKFKEISR